MFADGPSRLPTVPSADGTKCWQMGRPICRRARLQTGQNVGRWAVPSADGPVCRRDASPDGPEHIYEYIFQESSVVVTEIFEDPSVVVEDILLLHLVLIDVTSVCLCRMLGP